jgi:thymidine phosphorylase
VLDVKFGSGAFMKTREVAAQLAEAMTGVGERMGVKVSHLLSPMHEPLGCAVGNALEVAEAVDTLQGRGPNDLVQLTLDLAAQVATAPRAQLARRRFFADQEDRRARRAKRARAFRSCADGSGAGFGPAVVGEGNRIA